MKIKPEYTVRFYEDDICIVRLRPDGEEDYICQISETAAMAWEGIEHGIERDELINAIVTEFSGASNETVAADLDALMSQLVALGYAEA